MSTRIADKLIGLALTLAGLAFIAVTQPTNGTFILAGLVTMGGVSTIVHAQGLAAAAKDLAGLNPTSGGSGGQPAQLVSSPSAGTDQGGGR